jgi:hypothetical protein
MSHLQRALLSSGALCCMMAAGVQAQVVTGRVTEDGTDRALADAVVTMRTTANRSVASAATDSTGSFRLQAPRFGEFLLSVELIGMMPITELSLTVNEGATEVVLRMAIAAVPLEPLTVEARGGDAGLGPLRGYYERMRWNERTGIGRIITRDAIDARNPAAMSDMLREVPRLSVNRARGLTSHITVRGGRGGECTPALFIDGTRTNRRAQANVDELVRPGDVEGVEIYVGLAQMPGIYHDETGCGVLLIWTRRGASDGRPFSWTRTLVGIGIAGAILLIAR